MRGRPRGARDRHAGRRCPPRGQAMPPRGQVMPGAPRGARERLFSEPYAAGRRRTGNVLSWLMKADSAITGSPTISISG